MMGMRVYLDHNATSPLRPEARAAMVAALDAGGNPSSVHFEGRRARAIVETAREQVASLLNCKPLEVVFTSGATEANAWVGGASWRAILSGGIEHDSVRGPVAANDARQIALPVGADGLVDAGAVARFALRDADADCSLLMLQWANNETGIVQPVAEIGSFARAHGLHVHCDAVQAAGRLSIDFAAAEIDTLAISSHKLGGPAGVGALVVRDRTRLASFIIGGGQERRRRAGTENLSGIAGFGAAASAAVRELETIGRISALRSRLEDGILSATPGATIIGADAARLPNTTSVATPGLSAETLMIKLDLAGIAVSAGAACSSGKVGASHVLTAMGLPAEIASSAIRLSLGWNTSDADVEAFLNVWGAIARPRGLPAVA